MAFVEWGREMAMKSSNHPAGNRPCEQFGTELSAYFDGELAGDAKTTLERHVEICAPCRQQLDGMARLRVALKALAQPGVRRGGSVMDLLKDKLLAEVSPKKPSAS